MLDGDDASHGETSTVTRTIYFVNDRRVDIAASQKVSVQRVRHATVDGVMRRGKCLAENLSAEDLCAADVATFSAEDVVFDALQAQQPQEILENGVHCANI
jgi:hypothetical protein